MDDRPNRRNKALLSILNGASFESFLVSRNVVETRIQA